MIPILSGAARPLLDALARERALLVFDFDGTLAPLTDRPAAAAVPASTRALLRVTALLYPCAVVSGRSRADLLPRLDGIPLLACVGNHGAEAGFGPVDRALRARVAAWRDALRPLAALPGVVLEDKGLSIAVHYRAAVDRAAARRRALAAAAALDGARVLGGRAVVNVVPADAPDKGAAVTELLRRIGWRTAAYVGDDVADEDAFDADGVALAIRIGRTHASRARWYVARQADVDALLAELVAARRRVDGRDGIGALLAAAGPSGTSSARFA